MITNRIRADLVAVLVALALMLTGVLTQTGQILSHVPGHSTHTDANGAWIAGARLQGTLGPPLGIQASREFVDGKIYVTTSVDAPPQYRNNFV